MFCYRLMRSTVNDASQSGAAGVGTRPSNPIFDSASQTPPLRTHFAIASVATGREARGERRLGEGALAMSVAPESGRNRIMIYGPKPDGTYVVDRLNEAGAEDELKVISRQLSRLYFRAGPLPSDK